METLNAKIDRYLYRNNENSYSIAKVTTKDKLEEIVVGYLPVLMEDTFYDFTGEWVNHSQYGKQFKIESFSKSSEQTEEGLVSYLSSALFHGIGPVTASKIVELLGLDAIKKIVEDSDCLIPLKFSSERRETLKNELIENQINERTLVKLYSYNIAGQTAMKIINRYGMLAIEQLEENPYRLIKDIEGIGFIKADEIAKKIGIENKDTRRVDAAILYAIEQYSYSKGDLYIDSDSLIKQTLSILEFDLDIKENINDLVINNELILEDDRYYLRNSYLVEVSLSNEIKRLNTNSNEKINKDYIESILNIVEVQKGLEYTNLQKEAIINSLINKVSIITGGPGTGKTTIIDAILDIYLEYYQISTKNDSYKTKIGLMAPTGRAAKRMQEVLGLDAKTIHRHLGYGYDGLFTYDKFNQMPFDLIIIDEASMIDVYLAEKLFTSIKNSTKIIIVGDMDQLPSVSPGQVLKDLIESEVIYTSKLEEIHRQARDSKIISLAYSVNNKQLDYKELNSGNDLYLANINYSDIAKTIINQVSGALKEGYNLIDDIQVLVPMYRGDVGIDNLNLLMQEAFNTSKDKSIKYGDKVFYENDKVIQLTNNPEQGIMNGDIGYIKQIGKTFDNKDYLKVDFDGNEVTMEKDALKDLSLAYAMSIHKSQGSEYKIVIMPLVKQHMHMLKKELLYTAITRAKNYLIILGDINLLVYSANHLSEQRKTTLKLRLKTA